MANRVKIIAGPTASGKTAHAIACARAEGGVIINADSVQIYDALPRLSARPSAAEQQQAPHRLYAILAPEQNCSAARWRELALGEIHQALDAGQLPIITGGTGLYIKALLEGFSPIPDVPDEIRQELRNQLTAMGNAAFHEALETLDPVMAARLHPHDSQRLIRAREVLEATGKSLAHWQALPPSGPPPGLQFEITLTMPPREILYERCDRRFDVMIRGGVMDEVAALSALIDSGQVPEKAPVTHALGFHPLRAALQGRVPLKEAISRAKTETRHYAKRQVTWFRHQIKPHETITTQ